MKNIVLMFLSKLNPKAEKTQFSLMGCSKPVESMQTNETSIYQLGAFNIKIDKVFAFVTRQVKEETVKDGRTTLEFFTDRVQQYVNAKDIITCNFDEDNADLALDNIMEMAQLILHEIEKFKLNNPQEKIVLHTDMTGGMRNAIMMILGVMRLLEYSGIGLENVLYSNKQGNIGTCEDSKDVYRFFDLVAAAKEFKNFGSVKELKDYYEKEKYYKKVKLSYNLENLVNAMDLFSQSIKLCRYNEFRNAINNLNECILNFEQTLQADMDVNDKLFAIILPTIKDSYSKLLVANTELGIIEWCEENDYLQQALTLLTEFLPDYICGTKRWLYVPDSAKSKFTEKYNTEYKEQGHKGNKNYFTLVKYGFDSFIGENKKMASAFYNILKDGLKNAPGRKDEVLAAITAFIREQEGKFDISYDADEYQTALSISAYMKGLDDNLKNQLINSKLYKKYCTRKGISETADSGQALSKYLKFIKNETSAKDFVVEAKIEEAYRCRKNIEKLLDNNELVCCENLREDVLECVYDYTWIRNIRNSSNHARKDKNYASIAEIKERIKKLVERLQEMERNENA